MSFYEESELLVKTERGETRRRGNVIACKFHFIETAEEFRQHLSVIEELMLTLPNMRCHFASYVEDPYKVDHLSHWMSTLVAKMTDRKYVLERFNEEHIRFKCGDGDVRHIHVIPGSVIGTKGCDWIEDLIWALPSLKKG